MIVLYQNNYDETVAAEATSIQEFKQRILVTLKKKDMSSNAKFLLFAITEKEKDDIFQRIKTEGKNYVIDLRERSRTFHQDQPLRFS